MRRRTGQPLEFLHQVGARQAVEPQALDAGGKVPAGKGKQLRHSRHRVMECRVVTGELRDQGAMLHQCFDQGELGRKMVRVARGSVSQQLDQRAVDSLQRWPARAQHHAVPYRGDSGEVDPLVEPIPQLAG